MGPASGDLHRARGLSPNGLIVEPHLHPQHKPVWSGASFWALKVRSLDIVDIVVWTKGHQRGALKYSSGCSLAVLMDVRTVSE